MPVEKPNAEYESRKDQWKRCRDCIEGEDAVKAVGTAYLPQLQGQADDPMGYIAYRQRAMFYGASGRTVEGLTGSVFRKPPKIEFPESGREWLMSVSQDNLSFEVFAKKVLRQVISVGRHGVLLDMDRDEPAVPVPYLVSYRAEQVINWRTETIRGRETLTMVVLEEQYEEVDPKDPFVVEMKCRYRVLRLVEKEALVTLLEATGDKQTYEVSEGDTRTTKDLAAHRYFGTYTLREAPNLIYVQEVYTKVTSSANSHRGEYLLSEVNVPKLRGKPFVEIPFVFFGPTDLTPSTERPPILAIVNVNLSHYRNSADLEHGRHFTALPTAWASGFTVKEGTRLEIGSTAAWVSDEPGASVGFLEFSGAGLGHIADGMKDKEALMAVLGARMLEEPKRAVEAADTHAMRRSGEEATLASVAGTVEEGLQTLLRWAAEWKALNPEDVVVELNKDFVAHAMDPAMLTALVGLLQQGRMSYDTFFYNMERGELLPEGRTLEEELDLIDAMPPTPPVGPGMDLEDDEEEEDDEDDEDEDDPEDDPEEDDDA